MTEEQKAKKREYLKKYREENKERIKELHKKWCEDNKEKVKEHKKKWREENKEKLKEGKKKWYEENKEKIIEQSKRYREENKETIREWKKKYFLTNPYAKKTQKHRRRARQKNASGYSTKEQIQARFDYHGNKCYYCGDSSSRLEIEHRIPLARGGSNWPANIVPACNHCNNKKHTKTEREFKELSQIID